MRPSKKQPNALQEREGIVLLVVLSLLVLFVLVGVTYAIATRAARSSAKSHAKRERRGDDPRKELDQAMYQVLRGPASNAKSSMLGQSLLRDLYGESVFGKMIAPSVANFSPAGGQVIRVDVPVRNVTALSKFSPLTDFYSGSVFTVLDGPYPLLSTRVLRYAPLTTAQMGLLPTTDNSIFMSFYLEAFDLTAVEHLRLRDAMLSGNTLRFVINGKPYSGTGYGFHHNPPSPPYTATTNRAALTARVHGVSPTRTEAALMPHFAFGLDNDDITKIKTPFGAANEGYDAADYRNMFLAMVPVDSTANFIDKGVLPSFHRPGLIQYMRNTVSAWAPSAGYKTFRRQVVFRPMPWDHPNFTGSNPNLAGISPNSGVDGAWGLSGVDDNNNGIVDDASEFLMGENSDDYFNNDAALLNRIANSSASPSSSIFYDIDNDLNGRKDSIWLDFGLPIKTTPDGRRYKALIAPLITDLDSRIDINATGNLAQAVQDLTTPKQQASYLADSRTRLYAGASGALNFLDTKLPTPPGGNMPRGIGYGPAEINFRHLLDTPATANDFNKYQAFLELRNGAGKRPGAANTDDLLSQVRHIGWKTHFSRSNFSLFGSPPDIFGAGSFGLDNLGNPIFTYLSQNDAGANAGANQRVDDPYEKNLLSRSANDALFTIAELERVLRRADIDTSMLPNRLAAALQTSDPGAPAAVVQHGLVTTRSSYLPSLPLPPQPINFTTDNNDLHDILYNPAGFDPTARPAAMTYAGVLQPRHGPYPTILNLMAAKIYQQDPSVNIDTLNARLRQLLPFEFFHGEKLDVNRLWADGVDNNSNGVVDEPGEAGGTLWGGISGFSGTTPNFANDVPLLGATDARQIFARQLYCLMLLLVDLDVQGTTPAARNFRQPFNPAESLAPVPRRNLTARRIAQWAINVVDFRDPDAIMTPFLFDPNPYDGWNVSATYAGDRDHWVIGAEAPELLMTELVAFHDRRVRDTRDDPTKKLKANETDGTQDLDQSRLPQGSLFIELYCPRSRNSPVAPRELYTLGGTTTDGTVTAEVPRLNLDRTTPASAGTVFPVWRIAISAFHTSAASVRQKLTVIKPDSSSLDPVDLDLLATTDKVTIERVVWFTNGLTPGVANTAGVAPNQVFYRREAAHSAALRAGDYALIGPREHTYIGSQLGVSRTPNDTDVANQRIVLAPTEYNPANFFSTNATVSGKNEANTNFYPPMNPGSPQIKAPLTMIIASQAPTGGAWADSTDGVTPAQALEGGKVGLSISEPFYNAYYPEPTAKANSTHARKDSYRDYDTGTGVLPDQPFDTRAGNPLAKGPSAAEANRTFQDYKTAFLQRLANPLKPYNGNLVVSGKPNPNYNPYVTVDWSSIDLTVFDGCDDKNDDGATFQFRTRRPPGPFTKGATPQEKRQKIWNTKSATGGDTKKTGSDYFGRRLSSNGGSNHTLGFLNQGEMGTRLAPATPSAATGDPDHRTPFPWLVWNNRPFANPLELLQVPASSAGRLTHEFSLNTGVNPYGGATVTPSEFKGPYGHLLNFFHTTTDDGAGNPASRSTGKANYYRLLDFVETPSRYLGAQRWYNPAKFTTTASPVMTGYRPPFNKRSRFRDPGRINLNTISDYRVWEALTKGFFAMDPRFDDPAQSGLSNNQTTTNNSWARFLASRRGGAGSLGALPTQFANPFRSVGAANLAPTQALRGITSNHDGIQATLLRKDMAVPANEMLLDSDFTANAALTAANNSGMQYQPISRLANMVSGQSNVFAVWLTVGYFEVTPGAVDRGHPDGYRLGAEIGSERGEIKRHRAFYIIDRSIPAAFEPGKNHNVDDCVLLRRFIE